MATIKFKDGQEYLDKLSTLADGLRDEVIGRAVYKGAGLVADAVKSNTESLPVDNRWGTDGDKKSGINTKQKTGLIKSLGITPMRNDDGFLNVKIGFDGYNDLKTKSFPNGQPNQLIARSVERGTSFMKATPFVKRAVSATKKQALDVMGNTVDKEIENIMKG